MDLKKQVLSLSENFFDEINRIRKHLHQHPELSFQEVETSKYVKKKLVEFGIPYEEDWVKTGIVAWIEGNNPNSNCIALRADMDALPIQEKNETSYNSKNAGVMHACGHDVHTACLLGAAKILSELKNEWSGKAILIFQPGEEKFPGGASLMLEQGLIEKFNPKKIIAQHVYPEMEVGKVGFKDGMYMASADEIYIKIKGKGGHGALPHKNIDPVVIAANVILSLQSIVSRSAAPTIPSVLSFGKVIANGATNVIPSEVEIEGTFRTMNEDWRAQAHDKIKQMVQSISHSMGGECEIDIKKGYPFLINDKNLTLSSKNAAIELLGNENVEELELRMTAEDFSYFSQKIPACFYRLGVGNKKKNITSSVHSPTFDIDENALKTGMATMAFLALNELK